MSKPNKPNKPSKMSKARTTENKGENQMKNPHDYTIEELRKVLGTIQAKKAQRYAYNKTYQATHPKTEAQLASRKAYNRKRNAEQRELTNAILERAREEGLI